MTPADAASELATWLADLRERLSHVQHAAENLRQLGPAPGPADPEGLSAWLTFRRELRLPDRPADAAQLADAAAVLMRDLDGAVANCRLQLQQTLSAAEQALGHVARTGRPPGLISFHDVSDDAFVVTIEAEDPSVVRMGPATKTLLVRVAALPPRHPAAQLLAPAELVANQFLALPGFRRATLFGGREGVRDAAMPLVWYLTEDVVAKTRAWRLRDDAQQEANRLAVERRRQQQEAETQRILDADPARLRQRVKDLEQKLGQQEPPRYQ